MYYWDANATSKLRPAAVAAAQELLSKNYHLNPSSVHSEGRRARSILRDARERILSYLFPNTSIGQCSGRLIFVSGGTEACNSIIKGFVGTPSHVSSISIVSSSIEHAAILESVNFYKNFGCHCKFVNPATDGRVELDRFLKEVSSETVLATLMLANNETGVGQNVADICRAVKKVNPQAAFVSDITQAVSKTPLDLDEIFDAGVDAVSLSAHKLGGLPGVGAVIFNTKSTCRLFEPQIVGGGQENKLRGGTEFTLGAHVLGAVCDYLKLRHGSELSQRAMLKKQLINEIESKLPSVKILFKENPHQYDLCNTIYLRLPIRADDYAVALDLEGVKISTGSACSSGRQDVSHVPLSLGYSKTEAKTFFRISLDWDCTPEAISAGTTIMQKVLERFDF